MCRTTWVKELDGEDEIHFDVTYSVFPEKPEYFPRRQMEIHYIQKWLELVFIEVIVENYHFRVVSE